MNRFYNACLILAGCFVLVGCATQTGSTLKQTTGVSLGQVFAKPGIFQPHNGKYQAELRSSAMGGFTVMSLRQGDMAIGQEIDDVTGVAWITTTIVVYTVSPVYGHPGIYIFDSSTKEIKKIVAPKNINAAYPNGSDYFELEHLSSNKIYFYYAPDVDLINFKDFRSPRFLFSVNLEGNEFKKVFAN